MLLLSFLPSSPLFQPNPTLACNRYHVDICFEACLTIDIISWPTDMSSLLIFDCRTHDPPDFILTSLGSFFFDIVKYSTIFVCYQLDNILKLYLLSLSPLPCVPSIFYPLSSFSSTAQHFLLIRNSYVDSSLPLYLSLTFSLPLSLDIPTLWTCGVLGVF